MKLKVFQSDKGDCLLLTAEDGTRMLADGGMASSYREHVAPALGQLAKAGENLDLLYVSHIDRDHISGVLALLDDLVDWRVYDYQHQAGNKSFPKPAAIRPPEPARLWHNAFHDQVADNAGEVEQLLAASASVLEGSAKRALLTEAGRQRDLASSVPEGIELSRRASPEQLGIPVNQEFGGGLVFVRDDQARNTVRLGALKLTVIGPFNKQLKDLRKEWNAWLRDHAKALADLQRKMASDGERLALGQVDGFGPALAARAGELGDITKVTPPNLASLMLLVEADDASVLLTGDGHSDHILAGLEAAGRLESDGIHVDVLKVQHHGSENNIKPGFCQTVTADHYIFCGNGAHANPDLRAVSAIIDSRLGPSSGRTPNPAAVDRPFKLWFNSSSDVPGRAENVAHMREVEQLVSGRAKKSGRRLRHAFLDKHSLEIRL